MAETGPSRTVLVILVVVILVAAGAGIWAANYLLHPGPVSGPTTVQVGDNVTVNYIGEYGNGTQNGRVFDTSIYDVYANNVTYPKSLEYTPRGNQTSDYTPLPVHVGPGNVEYDINGTNYTTVVTGFWQGMLGLGVNQTRWVTFPDSLGYGALDPSCTQKVPLSFTVPVLTNVPTSMFSAQYPGVTPSPGLTFTDPTYGWSDLIFSMNSTQIALESLTTLGFVAPLKLGWNATVTALNSTTITLLNDITPSNYGSILGNFPTGRACGGGNPTTPFVISGVDLAGGTFTENWNPPVFGYTLTFRITIVQFVTT
jgi:FKBP-type peptidyl-prolyl cis-trans isomerase 2